MSTSFSGGCLEHLSSVQVSLGMAGIAGELSPDWRHMEKIEAECWDSWFPVEFGLGSFTNLFGMNGAVTGCVRMSDCTMNSRL